MIHPRRGAVGGLLASIVLVAASIAADPASLQGRLLDPEGGAAVGFLVLAQDVFSGRELASGATDESGAFRIQVPAGSRYLVFAAVTPEGRRLAVEPRPTIDVPSAGEYPTPELSYRTNKPARTPPVAARRAWYRTPAGLTGLTAGGVALLVLAFEDSDDEEPRASPSTP